MNHLIVELSKYLMILLVLFYSIFTLYYFRMKTHAGRSRICYSQRFFLFMMHFLGYLILYLQTENPKLLLFYVLQLLFLVAFLVLWRVIYPAASRLILNNTCMLLCIGFIMQARLDSDKAIRQFFIVVAAGLGTLLIPYIMQQIKKWEKGGWFYGCLGLGLLLVVLIFAAPEYGAKISLRSIGIPIQPSEFVKISFVFCVASLFREDVSFKRVAQVTVLAAAHVLVLVLCRDLGSAVIFFMAYLCMLLVATQNFLYVLAGLIAGSGASVVAFYLFEHVRTRVEVWQNPWIDITGKGWQIMQSLFAIGTGGWFGLGLYQGKAGSIPVAIEDFIFAAISEELGGIFALCLVLICLEMLMQFFWISTWMRERFQKIVVFGLAAIYGVQILINVGGVTKFIPSTGLTLPLISYGGSSMLATFVMLAIIQGYYILRTKEQDVEEEARREALRYEAERRRRLEERHRIVKQRQGQARAGRRT